MLDKLLKNKELCEWLQIHPSTLYRLQKKNLIPFIKLHHVYRFNVDEILRWMTQGGEELINVNSK